MFYKKLFILLISAIFLSLTLTLLYPLIKYFMPYFLEFINMASVEIVLIFVIFLIGYFFCKNNKNTDGEESEFLNDEIYKELEQEKIDGVKNIIKAHKSGYFFSLALIGPWGSGKSSFLWNLQQEIKKDKVINLNVWKLENIQNILQEIEKEFDNIIFELNKIEWILYHFKSIFIKNYFSILSKYLTINDIKIMNLSFSPTIQESKESYNILLKRTLEDKKIVLMLDELDRLDSKEDILNIFKIIRYLASFDKVFTITALDIDRVGEKVGFDYTHKIFNSKYFLPNISKNELYVFFKEKLSKKLSKIIDKDDFERLLNKKNLMDNINTYREIKNCYNDTYLLCKSLEDGKIKEWKMYIKFEFIFILNLIKSLNFDFYMNLIKEQKIFVQLLRDLPYKRIIEKKDEENKEYKNTFEKFLKFEKVDMLSSMLQGYTYNYTLEQSIYIFIHHQIYEYMFTEKMYEEFINNQEKIKEKYQLLDYNKGSQKSFLIFLIYRTYKNKELKTIENILMDIYELINQQNEYLNLIYELLKNFNNMGISSDVIQRMFKIFFEKANLNEDKDIYTINDLITNVSQLNINNLKFELYKIMYGFFKHRSSKNLFKIRLCNIQEVRELTTDNFSQFITLINEYLREDISDFFVDDDEYYIWTKSGTNSFGQEKYEGKKIKDMIKSNH